ncbi:LysR family transcriptional regulator [Gulbenkiania mobilis]|uniref:LysR family transcriptional regulator n=1 Tax=Gulbenkiania mobilis TaxID=397457 RepID=UPI0006BBF212|nr:LysR family transcriptional regulator [Gulbenkiania mobilis]
MKTTPPPSPDALLAFDALARQGSFTAAAEALGCAKSRVSQLVKELERDLGAVLVLRNTRRVALTEAGVRLAQHAARLRELLERVKPDITDTQGSVEGPLRIGSTFAFAQYVLAPLLAQLGAQYPGLRIELMAENRLQDPVESSLDFCLRTRNVHDDRLVAKSLGFLCEVPVATPLYLEQQGWPKTPEDLSMHQTLHNSFYDHGHAWRLEKGGQIASVDIKPTLVADQYAVLAAAMRAHQGIALLPHYVMRPWLQQGEVVEALPGWHTASWPIFLVYPYRQPMPKKYQVFLDFIVPRVRSLLGADA